MNIFSKKKWLPGAFIGAAVIAAVVPALAAYAYNPGQGYGSPPVTTVWTNDSSINFRISGSTTAFPIMAKVLGLPGGATSGKAQGGPFQLSNSADVNVIADVQQGGSTVGKGDVAAQTADIGMASSPFTLTTSGPIKATAIARDGVVIIVNSDVYSATNTNITQAQLDEIYQALNADGSASLSGITDWHTIFPSIPNGTTIVPVAREIGSGTRDALMGLAHFSPTSDALNADGSVIASPETVTIAAKGYREGSSDDMVAEVKGTPWSIGYVGVGYADSLPTGVKALTYGGIAATEQNVFTATYALSRFLWLGQYIGATDTNVSQNAGIDNDLITYVKSAAGQQIVKDTGFMKLFPDADINQDDVVDVGDLSKLGLKWGRATTAYQLANPGHYTGTLTTGDPADINHDGSIDVGDLSKLGLFWNLNGSTYGVTGGSKWGNGTGSGQNGQATNAYQVMPFPGMPAQQ